jgi:hypothetical protein
VTPGVTLATAARRRIRMTDTKHDTSHPLTRIATLRDEAKLHLHLASLDARKEWDEVLEPKVLELQNGAKHIGADVRDAASDVAGKLEAFVARLRDAALAGKRP